LDEHRFQEITQSDLSGHDYRVLHDRQRTDVRWTETAALKGPIEIGPLQASFRPTFKSREKLALWLGTLVKAIDVFPALFLERAADMYVEVIDEQFDRGGTAWEPLDADTLDQKGPGLGVLERSGTLRSALTDPDNPLFAEHVYGTGGDLTLRLGTHYPVFRFHQEGTKDMPARPLWIQDTDEARFIDRVGKMGAAMLDELSNPYGRG